MIKRTLLVASLALAGPVLADTFLLVTPLKSVPAFDESTIQLSLASAELPEAVAGVPYSVNLNDYLTVVDGYNRGPSVFSITGLPSWSSSDSSGVITGVPDGDGTFGISARVKYSTRNSAAEYTLNARYPFSCLELLTKKPGTPSGWYTLDVDGSGPAVPMDYYCDMTSAGGGWTRVVVQTENNPVTSWTGTTNGTSYTLAQHQIPAHTHTSFGRDDLATALDYVEFQYTTGNIPTTLVTGATGTQYHIHRSSSMHHSSHDPEYFGTGMTSDWNNTLTFDAIGGINYTWAFSPQHTIATNRGYAFNGHLEFVVNEFAWTVWVR